MHGTLSCKQVPQCRQLVRFSPAPHFFAGSRPDNISTSLSSSMLVVRNAGFVSAYFTAAGQLSIQNRELQARSIPTAASNRDEQEVWKSGIDLRGPCV